MSDFEQLRENEWKESMEKDPYEFAYNLRRIVDRANISNTEDMVGSYVAALNIDKAMSLEGEFHEEMNAFEEIEWFLDESTYELPEEYQVKKENISTDSEIYKRFSSYMTISNALKQSGISNWYIDDELFDLAYDNFATNNAINIIKSGKWKSLHEITDALENQIVYDFNAFKNKLYSNTYYMSEISESGEFYASCDDWFMMFDPIWLNRLNGENRDLYIAIGAVIKHLALEEYVYDFVGSYKHTLSVNWDEKNGFDVYFYVITDDLVSSKSLKETVEEYKHLFTPEELKALGNVNYGINNVVLDIPLRQMEIEMVIDYVKEDCYEEIKKLGLKEENRKLKSETVQKKTEKTEKVKTDEIIDIESFRSNEPMRKIPEDLEKTLLPNAYKNGSDKIREQLRDLASKVKKYIEKDALVADLNARIRDLEDEIQHIEEHEMSGIAEEYYALANEIKTDVEKPVKKSNKNKPVERD